jgi:hypothetical protein
MVMNPAGLGPENDCAGEGQQQLETTDPSSRERACYIRTMQTSVQLCSRQDKVAAIVFLSLYKHSDITCVLMTVVSQ